MSDKSAFISRGAAAWARIIVNYPGRVLLLLGALGVASVYLTTKLSIESDQLSLISQDLQEVKDVKRVIDMVGGSGYLMLALRGDDADTLKKASDALYARLIAEKENVRFITYKVPVDFIQENMVLFIKTEDLIEGKNRINAYLKDQIRRSSPFFVEIKKTEPVKLDLQDLIDKYSSVGKKSIRDSHYISDDRKMLLLLIKPMWGGTELQKTKAYIEHLTGGAKEGTVPTTGLFADFSKATGITLIEDYEKMGDKKTLYFGFTGSYKTAVDDSYAIQESLDDVFFWAFAFICIITIAFFRKWAPTVIVISGMALGTVLTMGFAELTLGELNMVTSMIGAILMGFGVDYGIHFIYRTRIELGMGKRYDEAITDALINAGRPALIAAIVTGGSFLVLLVSKFRGFSQFGFLAGFGTLIIGFTLFSWSPAILALLGKLNPELPKKLIGVMEPPKTTTEKLAIPHPNRVLAACIVGVLAICAFSIPWRDYFGGSQPAAAAAQEPVAASKCNSAEPAKEPTLSLVDRFLSGVRFNYNTRALVPEGLASIRLQDEINRRFCISSDPTAIYSKNLEEVKEIWDELTGHPEKYPSIDQVVSIYSFVPPPEVAAKNAAVLADWKAELEERGIDAASFPPEMQDKAEFFKRVLDKKPFGVHEVPEVYAKMFVHLPTTKPENHGYLTFIYPGVDLWDGKKMLKFVDETTVIKTASGKEFRSAGPPMLYARLARIVLFDGKLTVILAAIWILLMHYLDFRSSKLALASVIPLGLGLWMMLGMMSMTNHTLNFMNLVILPILLGFGVSHGLYLLHRFLEGTSPVVALRSVGAAVASSTLTAIAGFASLFFAHHNGLKSIGYVACLGLTTTLVVSFTVLAAVLQLIHDKRGSHATLPAHDSHHPPASS